MLFFRHHVLHALLSVHTYLSGGSKLNEPYFITGYIKGIIYIKGMSFDLMNDPCLTLWRMYDKKKMYVNCMTEKKTNRNKENLIFLLGRGLCMFDGWKSYFWVIKNTTQVSDVTMRYPLTLNLIMRWMKDWHWSN